MSYRPYEAIIAAATGQVSTLRISLTNNTGLTIVDLSPVRANLNGEMDTVDVSIESQVMSAVGILEAATLDGSDGNVVVSGKISNISTSFSLGDYVYVSKIGGLTNILPSEGIDGFEAGDFIIRAGVIAKNPINPLQKDLLVNFGIVGQL